MLEVNLDHLNRYNEILANNIRVKPAAYLPYFEEALNKAVDAMTKPRPDDIPVHPMQVTIHSDQNPTLVRELEVRLLR
eukprot:Pgem_evm1s8846